MGDPKFWVYSQAILYAVHGCLYEFQNYMEGCPCHENTFRDKNGFSPGRPYFQRRQAFIGETGLKNSTCPMRGRRAPDLAAGRHRAYLSDLVAQCLSMLLVRCERLSQQDRDLIVRDWELAWTAISEVIEVKYAHWEFLPHKFCILGCLDNWGTSEETARSGMVSCVRAYQGLDVDSRRKMWPLAAHVLDPDGPLRDEVAAFTAGGASLKTLPGLRQVAGMVLGIPVAERSVEAKHRLNKLATVRAPNASGSFVNVHLKLPDFRRRLHDDPSSLERVASDLGSIRTSSEKLLRVFGLVAHPTAYAEFGATGRVRASTAASIIYRLDPQTQQKQHTSLRKAFPKPPGDAAGPPPSESTNKGLRTVSNLALQHFRKSYARDKIYSIAIPGGAIPRLQSALAGTRTWDSSLLLPISDADFTPPLMLADGVDLDVQPEGLSDEAKRALARTRPSQPQEHTVFKVVHKAPSTRHFIKPHGCNLTHQDVAISVHDVYAHQCADDGSIELLVALSGVRLEEAEGAREGEAADLDPASTRLLHRCHLEAIPRLDRNFLEWQPEGGVFYMPKRWPDDFPREMEKFAIEAFTDLVNTGALPESDKSLVLEPPSEDDLPDVRVYEILERHGLVARSDHQGPLGQELVGWNISVLGLHDLAAFELLRRPSPALRRREGIQDQEHCGVQTELGGSTSLS